MAEYLKVNEDILLQELEAGNLHGFKIGKDWRCTDTDILIYIKGTRTIIESNTQSESNNLQPKTMKILNHDADWEIVEIAPFDFNWPRKGGGSNIEHYDRGYEATTKINDQEYTFKIGFGYRESAGLKRRRVTIWLGNRAIVEFAGSNDFDNDGLLAGIIRLRNGKQLTTQKIPEDYKAFKIGRYNVIVKGPRASTNMAVISRKDDLKCMLEHAVIRAQWKGIL